MYRIHDQSTAIVKSIMCSWRESVIYRHERACKKYVQRNVRVSVINTTTIDMEAPTGLRIAVECGSEATNDDCQVCTQIPDNDDRCQAICVQHNGLRCKRRRRQEEAYCGKHSKLSSNILDARTLACRRAFSDVYYDTFPSMPDAFAWDEFTEKHPHWMYQLDYYEVSSILDVLKNEETPQSDYKDMFISIAQWWVGGTSGLASNETLEIKRPDIKEVLPKDRSQHMMLHARPQHDKHVFYTARDVAIFAARFGGTQSEGGLVACFDRARQV